MFRFFQITLLIVVSAGSLLAQAKPFTFSLESGAFYSQYKGGKNLYAGIPRDDLDDTFTSFTAGASLNWHVSSVTDLVILDRLSISLGLGYQERTMEQTLHFWSGDKDLKEFSQSFNQSIYLGIRSRPNHRVRVDEPYLEFPNHHELYFRPEISFCVLGSDKITTNISFGVQLDKRINRKPNPYFRDIIQGGVAYDLEAILERNGVSESVEFRMATYSKQRWSYAYGLTIGYSINRNVSVNLSGNYFYGVSSIHQVDRDLGFIRDLHSYFLGGSTTLGMSWSFGKGSQRVDIGKMQA